MNALKYLIRAIIFASCFIVFITSALAINSIQDTVPKRKPDPQPDLVCSFDPRSDGLYLVVRNLIVGTKAENFSIWYKQERLFNPTNTQFQSGYYQITLKGGETWERNMLPPEGQRYKCYGEVDSASRILESNESNNKCETVYPPIPQTRRSIK